MRSAVPKPLHVLCGRAMVMHIVHAVAALGVDRLVVVVGHGAEQVTKAVIEDAPPHLGIEFVEQRVRRGTGDAMAVALEEAFPDGGDGEDLLVLPGDTPLLTSATLQALVDAKRGTDAAAAMLTAQLVDPRGYGRVVRDRNGRVACIVEQADASDDELAIDEVNTSIYCFRRGLLAPSLRRLSPENAQGEYYLTDVIGVLHDVGYPVVSDVVADPIEAAGVNDRAQLAVAEAELRERTNHRWMRRGVTMLDPERTYVDVSVELAPDVTLFPGTILQGNTRIGAGAEIGPDTRLVDCRVGAGAVVEGVVGRQASVGAGARVGPFVVLQPGSTVAADAITGSHLVVTPDT